MSHLKPSNIFTKIAKLDGIVTAQLNSTQLKGWTHTNCSNPSRQLRKVVKVENNQDVPR